MSLHAFRRWIARYPVAWVLGLALTLGGAQFAAAAHEFTHIGGTSTHVDQHANGTHDCPTCLLAAALGGAAPAPAAIVPASTHAAAPAVPRTQRTFAVRFTLPYASRAPPAPPVIAA